MTEMVIVNTAAAGAKHKIACRTSLDSLEMSETSGKTHFLYIFLNVSLRMCS